MKNQTIFPILCLFASVLILGMMPPSYPFPTESGFRTSTVSSQLFENTPTNDSTYIKELQAWHQKRIAALKSESGWLNLAGLFWLKEGQNTFGSDKSNAIVFPKGAGLMGQLTLDKGEVSVDIDAKAEVLVDKKPISSLKLFPSENNVVLESVSLRWFVIKRGDKYGIRLRDLESENLTHFTDVETYPIDSSWQVKAHLKTSNPPKTVNIVDVLGHTTPQASPGTLVFKLNGKTHTLDAITEGDELFILFADSTNGKETYGSGRFLYANKPDANGTVYLDFNKAINPPCAFTPFATCPLPPKQNKLAVAVRAGEKMFEEH